MSQGTETAKALVNDAEALAILKEHLGSAYEPVHYLDKTTDDIGQPTKALVTDLNLLEDGGDVTWRGTPFGKQVITAGATFITKAATGAISLAGLGTAIYSFYEGFPAVGTERLVLWGCATLLLAVAGLAVALVVRADIMARSTAMAAEYRARAQVASAYLQTSEDLLKQRRQVALLYAEKQSGDGA